MVVVGIDQEVRLTGFSDKKMTDHLFGPQESGHINEEVVRRGSTDFFFSFHPYSPVSRRALV